MKKVISAGGIVVRNNPGKQILLTIYSHIKGLGFAKGHVEKNETIEEAAIREVSEETGLNNLTIVKKLGVYTKVATERDGSYVEKDIHMFLMDTKNKNLGHTSEEDCGWFTIDGAISNMAVGEDRNFLIKIRNEL